MEVIAHDPGGAVAVGQGLSGPCGGGASWWAPSDRPGNTAAGANACTHARTHLVHEHAGAVRGHDVVAQVAAQGVQRCHLRGQAARAAA